MNKWEIGIGSKSNFGPFIILVGSWWEIFRDGREWGDGIIANGY